MNSAPKIVIIRGSVGAGKSSVIEVLARSISDVSSVDFDAFKRHIDSTESSEWRRKIAMNTALFLCEQLMQAKRNILVGIHSSQDDFLAAYRALAVKYGYALHSFMLHPPIEACIDRARKRVVPGISYAIDRKMIEKYWHEAVFITGEKVFRDELMSAQQIADEILLLINKPHVR